MHRARSLHQVQQNSHNTPNDRKYTKRYGHGPSPRGMVVGVIRLVKRVLPNSQAGDVDIP